MEKDHDRGSIAFVTSSFGFGPASKAVTIAKEFRKQMSWLRLDFFGAGVDYEFAQKTQCFDNKYQVDVDDNNALCQLLPVLRNYRAIFSILNLSLLPIWRKKLGKLYFVDSLAWMWHDLPTGISNTEAYFVQDYLVQPERIAEWQEKSALIAIPPIITDVSQKKLEQMQNLVERDNLLMVNFSGCSNPFVGQAVFENYVLTLSRMIIDVAASRFDRIQICCNQKLVELLRNEYGESDGLQFNHLEHARFLETLQNTRLLLTVPGITTTLEALQTRTPFNFLLPQNDSQAIVSEIYRLQCGDSICMAFSNFGKEFACFENVVDQADPIAGVMASAKKLDFILNHRKDQIFQKLETILVDHLTLNSENGLFQNITNDWKKTGQAMIVEHVKSDFSLP